MSDEVEVSPYTPASPHWWLFFQVDSRIATTFTRTDSGEDYYPDGCHWFGFWTVLVGGAVRLWLTDLYRPEATWRDPDFMVWWISAALLPIVGAGRARRTRQRREEGREIVPTGFVGWPRTLRWEAYAHAPNEYQRAGVLRRAYGKESLLVLAAGVGFLAIGWVGFGVYVLCIAWVLLSESLLMLHRERAKFKTLLNASAERARLQRIVEEIEQRWEPEPQTQVVGG